LPPYTFDVSVVIPTKNEELVVKHFIKWCNLGFKNANVNGEIIFADNSSDMTAEIAAKNGVKVVKINEPGVGRAYREVAPFIEGRIVILGDADCTYDFREITHFLDRLKEGYEFVIGSRFKGNIQKGAMPLSHQYFGTPITTAIFDFIHGVTYSDIHSGMRAMPTDVFKSILPQESGWQYASEMLAKVRHRKIRSIEIPINFYTAPNNRKSHLKRGGWKTPLREGVGTLVTTFKYAADRVLRFLSVISGSIGIPLLFVSTLDFSSFGLRQPTFGVQIAALGLCLIASTMFLLGSLSECIYGITNYPAPREKLRSALDRIFASYVLVFLLTLVFSLIYFSVLMSNNWQLPADYFYLSRLIAPIFLFNYVVALKTVVTALMLFITERNEYGK
jgi:glycosyltransferase involved in cell wall biosynthesis